MSMASSIRTKIRNLKRLRTEVLLEGDNERAKRINQEIQRLMAASEEHTREMQKLFKSADAEPQIANYENVDKLYAHYKATGYEKQFLLDGFMYRIVESKPNGIERIRKYKCMDEPDLFLYVHLASDVVLKVCSRYEIGVSS